jgi:inhibitor of cysteine peptidase
MEGILHEPLRRRLSARARLAPVSELVVGAADRGSSVEVGRGDVVVVRLRETPTSGFRWAIGRLDVDVLALEGSEFAVAEGAAVGGGGERAFSFRAVDRGSGRIELKLWREWEGDASIADRFDLTVRVA